jgi:hypothetical protein
MKPAFDIDIFLIKSNFLRKYRKLEVRFRKLFAVAGNPKLRTEDFIEEVIAGQKVFEAKMLINKIMDCVVFHSLSDFGDLADLFQLNNQKNNLLNLQNLREKK